MNYRRKLHKLLQSTSEIPYQLHRMRHRGELVKTAQLKKGRSDIEDKTTPSII